MPPPHGTAAEARSYSGIGNGRDRHPPARPTYTPPPKGGGGDGAHLRRKTTFAPKTKTITPKDTRPFIPLGGITGSNRFKNWATKFNINRPKEPSAWNKWRQHVLMSNLLKEGLEKDYHQTAAHDFTQRFNLPNWASKGLATGYQYGSELGKIFAPSNLLNVQSKTNPAGIYGVTGALTNVLSKAGEEARLNRVGIEGLTVPQQERYEDFTKMHNPYLERTYQANGGLIDLYRYGGFI
jgi:hypothetical protein